MGYWIARIGLSTGEVVTEHELGAGYQCVDGATPSIGDILPVDCRGRQFPAEVIWCGNADEFGHPLRVLEVGSSPNTVFYMEIDGRRVSLGRLKL